MKMFNFVILILIIGVLAYTVPTTIQKRIRINECKAKGGKLVYMGGYAEIGEENINDVGELCMPLEEFKKEQYKMRLDYFENQTGIFNINGSALQ